MRNESAKKVSLTSLDNLFGESGSTGTGNKHEAVSVYQLHAFRDHPFRVIDDAAMAELTASIRENGILSPIIVRKSPYEDGYEICAGHRRHHAAIIAGLTEVPVDIRELTDEQAVSLMVDTNIARPEILPSEKAWAYRMKWESQKHQGKHIEGNQLDPTLANENVRTIQRYIRLSYLIKPLLDLVDQKEMSLQIGGILSALSEVHQEKVMKAMNEINKLPTKIQADNLVELFKDKDNLAPEDEEREIQNILMGIVEPAPADADVVAENLPDNKNGNKINMNKDVDEDAASETETKSAENEYSQKEQEERNAAEGISRSLHSNLDEKSEYGAGEVASLSNQNMEDLKQSELPVLKNNDQRAEFIDAYETWPLWIETIETGERYYRYDLPDGTSLVVKVYHCRLFDYNAVAIKYEDHFKGGYGRCEYYLLREGKFFKDCEANRSMLIDKLKEIQKTPKKQ